VELSEILEGDKAEPVVEKAVEAPAPAEPTQPRDESGRFAPKGEKAEPAQAEPAAAVETQPDTAPPAVQTQTDPRESAFLAKAQDETRKRQRLEQDLALERQRYAEAQRQLMEFQAQKAPDIQTDPQGHLQYVRMQEAQSRFNEKLNLSERYARKVLGDELVSEAQHAFMSAAQRDPILQAQLAREEDPYGFVVKWHKREKLLAEIGDDPEAYRQRLLQQPAPQQAAPPRSLASATGVRVSEKQVAAEHKPLNEILGR